MSAKGAAAVMGVGGVVTAVGTFLELASGLFGSVAYFDTTDGKLVLGLGVAIAVFALVLAVSSSRGLNITMGVLGLLAALLVVVSVVIDWQSLGDAGASAGIAVYATLLGGILGLVGAIMAFRAPGAAAATAPPPPPPPPPSDTPE